VIKHFVGGGDFGVGFLPLPQLKGSDLKKLIINYFVFRQMVLMAISSITMQQKEILGILRITKYATREYLINNKV